MKEQLMIEIVNLLAYENIALRSSVIHDRVFNAIMVDPKSLGSTGSGRPRSKDWVNNALHTLKKRGLVRSPKRGQFDVPLWVVEAFSHRGWESLPSTGEWLLDESNAAWARENLASQNDWMHEEPKPVVVEEMGPKRHIPKASKVEVSTLHKAEDINIEIPVIESPEPWLSDPYLTGVAINSQSCFEGWDPSNKTCKGCPLRAICAAAQIEKVKDLMSGSVGFTPVEEEVEPVETPKAIDKGIDLSGIEAANLMEMAAHSAVICPITGQNIAVGQSAWYDRASGQIVHKTVGDAAIAAGV